MRKSILLAFVAIVSLVGLAQAEYHPTTIYDIQQDAFADNDSVSVAGVIVTGVDDIPSGYGFWVQEAAAGPHSGLYVFVGVTAPPAVAIGDVRPCTAHGYRLAIPGGVHAAHLRGVRHVADVHDAQPVLPGRHVGVAAAHVQPSRFAGGGRILTQAQQLERESCEV